MIDRSCQIIIDQFANRKPLLVHKNDNVAGGEISMDEVDTTQVNNR